MNKEHFLRLEDACVCCGAPICEGRQICTECEKMLNQDDIPAPHRKEKKRGWKGWWSMIHGGNKKPRIETGFRIGKLTVVAPTDQRKNGYTIWNCMCDCGGFIELDTRTLQRGTVRDCGCETKVKPGQKD